MNGQKGDTLATRSAIRIEVQVSEGCPHAKAALDLARAVAARMGPDITVEQVDVDTPEKAALVGFAGSPSVRVNGIDLEGRVGDGSLSRRVYEGGSSLPPAWLVEAAVLRARPPRGLLFLCVANSARSQLGEGIARALSPGDVVVQSAGSNPTRVRPEAMAVLAEIGIDISTHRAKHVSEIPAERIDTVITLCGEEECPLFLGRATRLHWGLPDPAAASGSDADRLSAFRRTRDELRRRLSVVFDHREPRP